MLTVAVVSTGLGRCVCVLGDSILSATANNVQWSVSVSCEPWASAVRRCFSVVGPAALAVGRGRRFASALQNNRGEKWVNAAVRPEQPQRFQALTVAARDKMAPRSGSRRSPAVVSAQNAQTRILNVAKLTLVK
jgi:hypothetical protein